MPRESRADNPHGVIGRVVAVARRKFRVSISANVLWRDVGRESFEAFAQGFAKIRETCA